MTLLPFSQPLGSICLVTIHSLPHFVSGPGMPRCSLLKHSKACARLPDTQPGRLVAQHGWDNVCPCCLALSCIAGREAQPPIDINALSPQIKAIPSGVGVYLEVCAARSGCRLAWSNMFRTPFLVCFLQGRQYSSDI